MNLLIIDGGHNEKVAGKESPDKSFREWIFNNEMQYLLKKRTEAHDIFVYLTNPNPSGKGEIGLSVRYNLANNHYKTTSKANALFISLHSNAYLKKDDKGHYINEFNSVRGTETFVASNASTKSRNAAKYVQDEVVKVMKSIDTKANDRGVKVEDFTVIYKTVMPSILVEYGFYTSKEDLSILKNNKAELVEATVKGICKYFGITYKPVQVEQHKLFAVCVSACAYESAKELQQKLIKEGYKDTYLIPRNI